MANNRMYLVHSTTGTAILLAKYYPTSGWYIFHGLKRYDDFFGKFNNNTLFGDSGFEIRYETDPDGNTLVGTENFPYNKGSKDAIPSQSSE